MIKQIKEHKNTYVWFDQDDYLPNTTMSDYQSVVVDRVLL